MHKGMSLFLLAAMLASALALICRSCCMTAITLPMRSSWSETHSLARASSALMQSAGQSPALASAGILFID